MPKKILKKILPSYEKIQKQKFLKIFGDKLTKREIWSLNRKRVLYGVFIGIFVACLPMPFQVVLAAFLAILIGANLALSLALLFVNNPLTIPPLFYLEYKVGALFIKEENSIEFDFDSIYDNFDQIAALLWTGSIVVGLVSAIVCVVLVNTAWFCSVRRQRKKGKKGK